MGSTFIDTQPVKTRQHYDLSDFPAPKSPSMLPPPVKAPPLFLFRLLLILIPPVRQVRLRPSHTVAPENTSPSTNLLRFPSSPPSYSYTYSYTPIFSLLPFPLPCARHEVPRRMGSPPLHPSSLPWHAVGPAKAAFSFHPSSLLLHSLHPSAFSEPSAVPFPTPSSSIPLLHGTP